MILQLSFLYWFSFGSAATFPNFGIKALVAVWIPNIRLHNTLWNSICPAPDNDTLFKALTLLSKKLCGTPPKVMQKCWLYLFRRYCKVECKTKAYMDVHFQNKNEVPFGHVQFPNPVFVEMLDRLLRLCHSCIFAWPVIKFSQVLVKQMELYRKLSFCRCFDDSITIRTWNIGTWKSWKSNLD